MHEQQHNDKFISQHSICQIATLSRHEDEINWE